MERHFECHGSKGILKVAYVYSQQRISHKRQIKASSLSLSLSLSLCLSLSLFSVSLSLLLCLSLAVLALPFKAPSAIERYFVVSLSLLARRTTGKGDGFAEHVNAKDFTICRHAPAL